MQSNEVVAHPESGRAALKVVSYVELDVEQLAQAVAEAENTCQNAVTAKAEHEAKGSELADNVSKAEADLADKKSQLEASTAINSELPGAEEDGAVEPDASVEEAGAEPVGASEPAGDNGDGAVEVPVTVAPVAPQDEY